MTRRKPLILASFLILIVAIFAGVALFPSAPTRDSIPNFYMIDDTQTS